MRSNVSLSEIETVVRLAGLHTLCEIARHLNRNRANLSELLSRELLCFTEIERLRKRGVSVEKIMALYRGSEEAEHADPLAESVAALEKAARQVLKILVNQRRN